MHQLITLFFFFILNQLVKFGNQAEEILRTSVIQAKPKDESTLELKINKETSMFDNVIYKD